MIIDKKGEKQRIPTEYVKIWKIWYYYNSQMANSSDAIQYIHDDSHCVHRRRYIRKAIEMWNESFSPENKKMDVR